MNEVLTLADISDRSIAYFWSRVETKKENDCWNWTGQKNSRGYGRIAHQGRRIGAHRFSVALSGREVPSDLFCDHICQNPACVNPKHLRMVPPRVNALENSDSLPALNLQKTYCRNGHEFSSCNTYTQTRNGRNHRLCRKCKALATKRHYLRKKAAYREGSDT